MSGGEQEGGFQLRPHLLVSSSERANPRGWTNMVCIQPAGWRVRRTAIPLTALCQLHPLRASLGKRPRVFLSWALAGGSKTTGPSPLSSLSSLAPASQVCAAHRVGPAQYGWVVSQGLRRWWEVTHSTCFSLRPVFPDTKPYGVLDLEVPGKLPATAWEKGKGSEVSVMLTVSAAAAKVCPRGTLRQRAVFRACLDKKVTTL